MRRLFLLAVCCMSVCFSQAQKMYKGLPVLMADEQLADYRIGEDKVAGAWTILPEVDYDPLKVTCFSIPEDFTFYTDKDSINMKLKPGDVDSFYVKLKGAYALTGIEAVAPDFEVLRFDGQARNDTFEFWYEQNDTNQYLAQLRNQYPIDSLVQGAKNDQERALRVLHWVHNQWPHNGDNQPSKSDAITILEEAKAGNNFRCVEYGIVTAACLNAIGLKTRTLALKTKDVETRESGAGHLLAEVFLNDQQKWVVIDGQWDAMPVLFGKPLNAVEFQRAIAENYKDVAILTASSTSKRNYIDWIYPYLYYFDTRFDHRETQRRYNIAYKSSVMLVPIGAKSPRVFQRNSAIDNCFYTHSLVDFYAPPK